MFKNYFKIALRNLKRNKLYNFINIAGLAVALTACILIFIYIRYELSYDRFNKNADRIFRVYTHSDYGVKPDHNLLVEPYLLGPALKKSVPGVKNFVRIFNYYQVLISVHHKNFYENNFYSVDPSIFNIFTFPLIRGNKKTALNRPFTVVLSQGMAKKLFGNKNPMGKTISVKASFGKKKYEVTGVMKNVPNNAHFHINFLTSIKTHTSLIPDPGRENSSFFYDSFYTYILLKKGIRPGSLKSDLRKIYASHYSKKSAASSSYKLQPLTSIHLYSHLPQELGTNSNIKYLYIFGSIALLILLIAGVNYINLMTARSDVRAMEVGIKKTLGVNHINLITRFLCESLLYSLIAFIFATVLSKILLSYFDHLTGLPLTMHLFSIHFLFTLFVAWFIIGVLAGVYPAFILSNIQPEEIFRRKARGKNKSYLRNALIVFQFTISIILIIGTLVINSELNYIRHTQLGLNPKRVVMVKAGLNFYDHYKVFKTNLLGFPDIKAVTFMNMPLPATAIQYMSLKPGGLKSRLVNNCDIGPDFIKTLEIPLDKGEDISELATIEKDSTGGRYIPALINEAALKAWGWRHPIGKKIKQFIPNFKVVGVVSNFNYRSLKEKIQPLVLWPNHNYCKDIFIRISNGGTTQALAHIKKAWSLFGMGTPLNYTFLSNNYESIYKPQNRLAALFRNFSILAIIIACMGLLGLTAFSAERRTKEIGIRKVNGASVWNIVRLLVKDFLILVGIGFLIAIPIAWYAMHHWLQNFAYHIHIGVWTFVLAGILAMVIALATVSWQSIKAALANPVDSLRNE